MVKSTVARGSNKCKTGEAVQREVLAVAESSSSGAHSPEPNFLSGSGIALGVARAQEPLERGSNPEDISLTQLTEEISFTSFTN